MFKKIRLIALSWCLLISMLGGIVPAYAANGAGKGLVTVPQAIEDAASYIMAADGNAITDWDAYALAKAGKPVPASYLTGVSSQLQQNGGIFVNVTDYARVALGVKSAGGNPEHITAGSNSYNLIQSIYNSDKMTTQTNNAAIYSLLALSSGTYTIPSNAKWSAEKIAGWLVDQKNPDGGWPLALGGVSNVDITASAINALSPYKQLAGVQQAIDQGVQWLSLRQLANGGFSEFGENAESTAQVILGLSSAGVDARSAGFVKANGNPLSYLFSYRKSDGGFVHVTGGDTNSMATGQAIMALAAYHTFTAGNSGSYDAVLTTGSGAPSSASVTVKITGPSEVIAEGPATAANAFEALTQVLQASGVPYHESGHYIDTVNGIKGTNIYWWYNVKRQGKWDYAATNITGSYEYKLQNGDEVYLYMTGWGTPVVQSITVDPELPMAGQAFQVKVQQSVWSEVYTRDDITVAKSVYVEIGGQKAQTNNSGIAQFPSGLPGGSYKALVTGIRPGLEPTIVTNSKNVQMGSADIRIEGSSSTYAAGTGSSLNLLDSIKKILTDKQVSFKIDNTNYLQSVGSDANGWSYNVYRQAKWDNPMAGMADYKLQPGDQAIIYFGGYDANGNPTTFLVDSIAVNPVQPKASESFTVTVNKTAGYGNTPSPAAGIQVKIGSLTATTNDQGVATFAGLPQGTYTIDVSGYVTGGAPKVVHTTQPVTILQRTGGVSGGGSGSVNPVAYLSVAGDSGKGTILSLTQVSIQSGDTPYSILIRTLGADRVQSSGSGPTAYVQGIDGLREFDKGPLSGWMYAVNGSYLSTGADATVLKSGDTVAWRYTLNGGTDLKTVSNNNGGSAAVTTGVAGSIIEAAQTLNLNYDNVKPISEIAKPAVVLNADKIMSTAVADQLKKDLTANTVNLDKTAAVFIPTVIADAKTEVQLDIPAGALKEITGITVNELSTSGRNELVSSMYEFGPTGLSFEKPVQIAIKVPLTVENVDQLALVWLNELTGQWIPIPAVVDAETGTVTGIVNHFTKFAVIDKSKVMAAAAASYTAKDIAQSIDKASQWLKSGVELSDWSAYALSRAGVTVPSNYLTKVEAMLKEKNGIFRNVTDYERLALSVQAAGGNPESIGGFNLIERIYNNERMEVQGSNGPIYGLLALNDGAYRIPADAKWTTEKLLQLILEVQNADGSLPLVKGETGNPDLTGAALAALTPYKERAPVRSAMEKAVKWLGSKQTENGGFMLNEVENAESTAQVIWGLAVSGIDPTNSSFFKSGDKSMLAYLMGLQLSSGAYPHTKGGKEEVIATEQALMALGAYQAYLNAASSTAPATMPVVYADQAQISSWAVPFVQKAAAYRIMEGTGTTVPTFDPKKQVTRAQFTTILLRLLGEAPSADAKSIFSDVASDSWYAGYVIKAFAKGIVEGVSADRFAPDAAISRQEMAIMLARALQLKATSDTGTASFIDLNQAYPGAAPFIQAVREKGLMEGDEAGRFLPMDTATREMAAVVAVRAFELTKN